ncbi:trypsin-like serine peptidase [Methylobacter psychrophilus]|uniref:trypsin-like serine peptidase n=1 Tax=Methylobacter psychrophilus TaxID=96941 RepID=UPI0021D4CC8D|nr:serine protease [Methylobacter psychrophilus]
MFKINYSALLIFFSFNICAENSASIAISKLHTTLPKEATVISKEVFPIYHDPDDRGVVFFHKFTGKSESTFIAVHFVINQLPADKHWSIILRSNNGAELQRVDVNTINSKGKLPLTFWSKDLEDNQVALEVISDHVPDDLKFTIDKYLYEDRDIVPLQIFDRSHPHFEYITNSTPEKYLLPSKNVARLSIVDKDERYPCTGFRVGREYMLTAAHCMPVNTVDGNDCNDSFSVSLNHTFYPFSPVRQVECNKIVHVSHDYDYAILSIHVNKKNSNEHTLELSASNYKDLSRLFIVHHPAGRAKTLTQAKCGIASAPPKAESIPCGGESNFLYHTCDTEGGSSGAPIFDSDSGKIVGLHTDGFVQGADIKVNCGIFINNILNEAKQFIDLH